MSNTGDFVCCCGFKTTNKGAYVQHIRQCKRYKQSTPVGRRISKFVHEMKDNETPLGATKQLSRCCYEEMVYDKKKGVPVCKKCGKSSWEIRRR